MTCGCGGDSGIGAPHPHHPRPILNNILILLFLLLDERTPTATFSPAPLLPLAINNK
jgi:hypothetical protein